MTPLRPVALPALVAVLTLTACVAAPDPGTGARVGVDAGTCVLSTTTVPAGPVTFSVQNTGSDAAEFYVYGPDGTTVLSEVENVGPGITRDLVVELAAGAATATCRTGDGDDGVSTALTVEASGVAASPTSPALAAAVDEYRSFVATESAALLAGTKAFVSAVRAGDVAEAKRLYPETRVHWERIEPVVESFADLDYALDVREDGVEPGTEWTGWHRLEKALWVDSDLSDMGPVGDKLLTDTQDLVGRIGTLELSASLVGNGAAALMEEVATGKVTGEEERYSRTDLWDFQANVDGARAAYDALEAALRGKDTALADRLESRFEALDAALAQHRSGAQFVRYDELTPAQVRELADAVDALAEPLSTLTAKVVSS
jgi:iron uptake system component EfeO